jgi:hypothetical protein
MKAASELALNYPSIAYALCLRWRKIFPALISELQTSYLDHPFLQHNWLLEPRSVSQVTFFTA